MAMNMIPSLHFYFLGMKFAREVLYSTGLYRNTLPVASMSCAHCTGYLHIGEPGDDPSALQETSCHRVKKFAWS